MITAKDIVIKQIDSKTANALVRKLHYSGKVAQNSQLHLGAFIGDVLHGAMQFGPSLDKRKIQGLVSGTEWHEFLELNRMAFDEALPRNSESRALAIAFRLLRKYAPQVKWVVSFADGTQCGDGTIYRASGFVLTGIKKNTQIWEAPSGNIYQSNSARGVSNCNIVHSRALAEVAGARFSRTSLTDGRSKKEQREAKNIVARGNASKGKHILENGASSMRVFKDAGFKPLEGFQLRYIYFIDKSYRSRLTVPEIPFSEIEKRGAKMYKGERLTTCGQGEIDNALQSNAETGGASPTCPLQPLQIREL